MVSRVISDVQTQIIGERLADQKVVVTGGAGFIGSNLCLALAAYGANVIAIDNFLEGGGANEENLAGVPVQLIRGDLLDIDLHAICHGADIIFNLAGYTSHIGSEIEPERDLAINAAAQLRLILALRDTAPTALVIHASTRQIYGRPTSLPVDESHPTRPPDANGVSKLAGEHYWMLEHRSRGRPVVSLRLTNCYGPRLRIVDARQGFLGKWFGAALTGVPFEVWGGDQLRDIAFVDDVVGAFLLAAIVPACHGHIFNIGGSPPHTLKEIAELLVLRTDGRATYVIKTFSKALARIDIGSYYTDDKAFRSTSGWAPMVDVADGFGRTLDWFRPRQGSYLFETANAC
jgi:UDP-glucose 4-epimerase